MPTSPSLPTFDPLPPGKTPPTQEEIEAQLHRQGYDCFCWYDVPGANYPAHAHSHDECIWVVKGEILFQIGQNSYHLKTGDRLWLSQGTHHTAQVPPGQAVTYIVGLKRSQTP